MSAPASAHKSTLYGGDPALLSPFAARLLERGVLKWFIAIAGSLGAILEVIDTVITNVALPDIRGNLGASLEEAAWISTGYACANVVIIPLSAWLGYRFGKKNYFIFSLVAFTVASFLCGISANLGTLIFARVFQGLAGGGLLAKAQAIVFESFPPPERPMAQALFGLGVIVGPAVGPVIGGWLTDNLGWRWIFFINLPVGLLAFIMCSILLPRDEPVDVARATDVDWGGIGLLAIGLASFQVILEEGQRYDWFDSQFISWMAVASVVGLALFVWRELSVEHPAVDLRILRYPSVVAGSMYSAILGMGIYGIMFAVPVFVQDYLHYTALQSGELLVPGALASAVAMAIYGKIVGNMSPAKVIFVGALITAATGALLSTINTDTGAAQFFWPLIMRGLGSVLIFMPLSIATLGPLPKKDIAALPGFYNLTRQLGSSIGIALITTMLVRREATHRAALVEKVTLFRTPALERMQELTQSFTARLGDEALGQHQAMTLLDRIVSGQAALLAYQDLFFYASALFIVTLPIIYFLRSRGKKDVDAQAVMAEAH